MQTLLWRLERNRRETYLFGTMHTRDERAFGSLGRVYRALEATELFAAEFALNQDSDQRLQELLLLPAHQPLSRWYGQRKFDEMSKTIKKHLGLDLHNLQHLTPFAIISIIDSTLMGSERAEPLDIHLWNYARARDKQLAGLETTEEHYSVLEQMPLAYQLRQLTAMAAHLTAYRRKMQSLSRLYADQNIRQLYLHSSKGAGHMRRTLLHNRNRVMAARFEALSLQHSVFAAIGAAHLPGEQGLLRLLKHRGFKVSPM
jgi:uncharacterized protein YbaP (TraB family)